MTTVAPILVDPSVAVVIFTLEREELCKARKTSEVNNQIRTLDFLINELCIEILDSDNCFRC
jgi:hypothetical protein